MIGYLVAAADGPPEPVAVDCYCHACAVSQKTLLTVACWLCGGEMTDVKPSYWPNTWACAQTARFTPPPESS